MKPEDLDPLELVRWSLDDHRRLLNISKDNGWRKQVHAAFRQSVMKARFLNFDAAASHAVGVLSTDFDLLDYFKMTAAMPWPNMVIMINLGAYLRGSAHPADYSKTADPAFVWLLEQQGDNPQRIRATGLTMMNGQQTANSGKLTGIYADPIGYTLDLSGAYEPTRNNDFCDLLRQHATRYLHDRQPKDGFPTPDGRVSADALLEMRDPIDLLILGKEFVPYDGVPGDNTIETRNGFAHMIAPTPCRYSDWSHLDDREKAAVLEHLVKEVIGAPRQLVAALAVLAMDKVITESNPKHAKMERKEGGTRLVGGRRTVYMAVDTLKIDIAAIKHHYESSDERSIHMLRRRHEVRGHWCHFRRVGSAKCLHEWVTTSVGDEPHRQECKNCGMHRTWRRHHQRGDAAKGFAVRKNVAVKGPH